MQRTKKQYTPAGKRLSLLYTVHEVFRGAAKDPDMDLDYGAWKDALRALVPWAWRKQKEEDQAKIRKAVSLRCTWLGHDLGLRSTRMTANCRYSTPFYSDTIVSCEWERKKGTTRSVSL